jgi:hypothetical protein
MTLEQLINKLKDLPADAILPVGITDPHSYRGNYLELAFEPTTNQQRDEAIAVAKSAIGTTYNGYKGGKYLMGIHDNVHLAKYGECEDDGFGISGIFVEYYKAREK